MIKVCPSFVLRWSTVSPRTELSCWAPQNQRPKSKPVYIVVLFCVAVECLRSQDKTISLRSTKQTIQLYLFSLCPSTPGTAQAHVIHQFCCTYNHARHSPSVSDSCNCFVCFCNMPVEKKVTLLDMDLNKWIVKRNAYVIWQYKTKMCMLVHMSV